MPAVSEMLKTTFDSARDRLIVLEKGVQKLEKRARTSFGEIQAQVNRAPKRIEGAFSGLVERVKQPIPFATRAEVRELAQKLDELSAKVDKLTRGRKSTAS